MADRFLIHKPSGVVYVWQSVFANKPGFEECADAKGTPLNIIEGEARVVADDEPPVIEAPKKGRKSAKPVDEELDLDAALSRDASKGL